jgi:hypothetical protein
MGNGSMEAKVDAPTEQDSVAETTAVHVANIHIGWFSYTLVNQVAISRISLAGVPGQVLVISRMRGHILTLRQVVLVLDTAEVHSLAHGLVPTSDRTEAVPNRRTLPSGS